MSASSETTIYVNFERKSYKLGEFIFDYKYDK